MQRILISACFLGENVRYNGIIKSLEHHLIKQWQNENRLVPICPEVIGGLSTPRAPAEYNRQYGKVITMTGIDVSSAFELGAKKALELCQKHQIKIALLKEYSPSCGSNMIYDGSFSQRKIIGSGVTTTLLRKNKIRVYSEENIDLLLEELNDYD